MRQVLNIRKFSLLASNWTDTQQHHQRLATACKLNETTCLKWLLFDIVLELMCNMLSVKLLAKTLHQVN